MSLRRFLPILAALLFACAHDDPAAPPASTGPVVQSVTVGTVAETLLVGDSVQLTARAADASGIRVPGAPIAWRSLDPSVAAVDTAGLVHAVGDGAARIVVATGEHEDTALVNARAPLHFRDLAVGQTHACGLTIAGVAYCWGSVGRAGVLGTGDGALGTLTPVRVAGGHSFRSLSASETHTCGVDDAGSVWCWGYGGTGALGDPAITTSSGTPVRASATVTFASVDVGYRSSCALTTSGEAWCWGWNAPGAPLGVGDTTQVISAPRAVVGDHQFTRLAHSDSHQCALSAGGDAWCWGSDQTGQLGKAPNLPNLPAGPSESVPVRVEGVPAFTSIDAGTAHSCAIAADSLAWCWGFDFYGESGNHGCCVTLPALVPGGRHFAQISAGFNGTCAVTASGETWCWGLNDHGQLGSPPSSAWPTFPARATWLPPLRLVRLGELSGGGAYFSCGIARDDTAYCWGTSASGGELGDGSANTQARVSRVTWARGTGALP